MNLTKRSENWLKKLKETSLNYETLRLMNGESVEIGYRSSCGYTDQTMKDFRILRKFLDALKSQGFVVSETVVSHKNAYATNNGGFWNSYIFKITE